MEKKNVLHTEQVKIGDKNRSYFLDLKEAENGNNFLVINQTKSSTAGNTERIKMILFEEDLESFSQALIRTLFYFKKNNKSKKEADEEYITKVRQEYPNAFQRWSKEDELMLKELYQQGHKVEELMVHFKRNERGIIKRLEMMGIAANSNSSAA